MPAFRDRQRGFTLIELMITIAVVAVVVGFAMPQLGSMIRNGQMVSQGNSLLGGVQYARGEALARGQIVRMCGSSDGVSCDGEWGRGWVVFADEDADGSLDAGEVLRTDTSDTAIDSSTAGHFVFTHQGRRGGGLETLTIKRSDCGSEGSRTLSVTAGGRTSMNSGGC